LVESRASVVDWLKAVHLLLFLLKVSVRLAFWWQNIIIFNYSCSHTEKYIAYFACGIFSFSFR